MASSTVTVRYSKTGKPAKNIKVAVSVSGLLSGGIATGYTDSAGNANIDHASESVSAKVIVNGKTVGTMRIPGAFNVNI